MDISSVQLIKQSKNLHEFHCINSIIEIVVEQIKTIPQYERLARSIDLILQICQLLENLCYDNNVKAEKGYKLDMAIKIYEKLFSTKPEDRDFLIQSIKFLHSNNKIKRVKFYRKVIRYLKNVLFKKE